MTDIKALMENEYFITFETGVGVGLAFAFWCWFFFGGFPVAIGLLAAFKTLISIHLWKKIAHRLE